MPRGRGGGLRGGGRDGSRDGDRDRGALLAAAALQDNMARRWQLPGGPKNNPSFRPGASLTLAQHLGLIPKPDPLLTEREWNQVHLNARIHFRSTTDCAICREGFKQEQQVLLSCGHVFHTSCIKSFEKFARRTCCPLCRASQYQKKAINDGAIFFRHKCATRIQAVWRGCLARRRAKELRKHHPPQDPRLLRLWAAERLEDESNKYISEMKEEKEDIDDMFAEFDATLALSRSVFSKVPVAQHARWEQGQGSGVSTEAECTEPAVGDVGSRADSDALESNQHTADNSLPHQQHLLAELQQSSVAPAAAMQAFSQHAHAPDVNWAGVVREALSRKEIECPICIGALNRNGERGIAFLSCTHCFHEECIATFEAFELSAGGLPSCPVCRANYQRRCFQ